MSSMVYLVVLSVVMALAWGVMALVVGRLVAALHTPEGDFMKVHRLNAASLFVGVVAAFIALASIPAGLARAFGALESVDAAQRADLLAERTEAVMNLGSPVALGGLLVGGVAVAFWAIRRQKLRDMSRDET